MMTIFRDDGEFRRAEASSENGPGEIAWPPSPRDEGSTDPAAENRQAEGTPMPNPEMVELIRGLLRDGPTDEPDSLRTSVWRMIALQFPEATAEDVRAALGEAIVRSAEDARLARLRDAGVNDARIVDVFSIERLRRFRATRSSS